MKVPGFIREQAGSPKGNPNRVLLKTRRWSRLQRRTSRTQGLLSVFKCDEAGQCLAFEHLQTGSAAGADMSHLVSQTGLIDGRS